MSAIQEIHFKSVDVESVESVEDNPEAVTFDIILSSPPTSHWLEEFEYLYSRAQYSLKPPIHVSGDRMRILYLPRYGSELQNFVSFLSLILGRATLEARRTIEIQQTGEKQKLKSQFKSALAGLVLPKPGVIGGVTTPR
jgi:hypothetical protein